MNEHFHQRTNWDLKKGKVTCFYSIRIVFLFYKNRAAAEDKPWSMFFYTCLFMRGCLNNSHLSPQTKRRVISPIVCVEFALCPRQNRTVHLVSTLNLHSPMLCSQRNSAVLYELNVKILTDLKQHKIPNVGHAPTAAYSC